MWCVWTAPLKRGRHCPKRSAALFSHWLLPLRRQTTPDTQSGRSPLGRGQPSGPETTAAPSGWAGSSSTLPAPPREPVVGHPTPTAEGTRRESAGSPQPLKNPSGRDIGGCARRPERAPSLPLTVDKVFDPDG